MTRILIVDDNPSVRAALRMCFKMKTDWIVCGEAGNGDAAIEMARSVKPDVVLLDYAMPVMNGLEAARILSALAPKCAILMYTMFASPDLSELARAAGGIEGHQQKCDERETLPRRSDAPLLPGSVP